MARLCMGRERRAPSPPFCPQWGFPGGGGGAPAHSRPAPGARPWRCKPGGNAAPPGGGGGARHAGFLGERRFSRSQKSRAKAGLWGRKALRSVFYLDNRSRSVAPVDGRKAKVAVLRPGVWENQSSRHSAHRIEPLAVRSNLVNCSAAQYIGVNQGDVEWLGWMLGASPKNEFIQLPVV